MNIDATFFSKLNANYTQEHINNIIYHDEAGFISEMQGWFNTHKLTE